MGPRADFDVLKENIPCPHGNRTQDRLDQFTQTLLLKRGSNKERQEDCNKQQRIFTKRDSNTSYLRLIYVTVL